MGEKETSFRKLNFKTTNLEQLDVSHFPDHPVDHIDLRSEKVK
jgi:hypothetical protein